MSIFSSFEPRWSCWLTGTAYRSRKRKYKGFHDEPLKGDRQGQRSVRLNRAYRAIYVEREGDEVVLINVMEVNKHGY